MAPTLSTRTMPNRSAIAPANGWPIPHSRFCSAKASAKTSRPQPFAADIGVRKKPKAERGPNPISEIRQPHRMMTAGVRQVRERAAAEIWVMGLIRFGRQSAGAAANLRRSAVKRRQNR
jgi:hypothetical protein